MLGLFDGVHAAVGAELEQVGQHAQHVGPGFERYVAQLLEADLVDRLALGQKAFLAGHVVRRQPGHLVAHGLRIAAIVEHAAVVKTDAVKRCYRFAS